MSATKYVLCGMAVFALTFLPFSKSVGFGLVNCDDYQYMSVRARTVREAFTEVQQAIWMPLTFLAYSCDHVFSKGRCTPSRIAHAGNVLGHALNAVLLFALLSLILSIASGKQSAMLPALGALFWSLHPLRCESVVWVASKKDVISTFFLLFSILSWCHWRIRNRWIYYWIALAGILLGAMAKPSVMVFIGLVIILDYFVFHRNTALIESLLPQSWRRQSCDQWQLFLAVKEYALPFAICVTIAIESALMQRIGGATIPWQGIPLWWKLLNAVNSLGVYVLTTFYPFNLAPQCQIRYPGLPAHWQLALPIAIALVGLVWLVLKKRSFIALGLLWFVGSLIPFLGFSGFGYHAYADRFTYISAMGLSVILVWWMRNRRTCARASVGLVCLALAALALRQTSFWRDDGTIWNQTLKVDGERNFIGNLNLALWHWETDHDIDACCRHFDKAWQHDPSALSKNAFWYIAALLEKGDFKKADEIIIGLRDTAKTVVDAGGDGQLLLIAKELGNIMFQIHEPGGTVRARKWLDDMLKIDPKYAGHSDYLFLMGKINEAEGRIDEARRLYRDCVAAANPQSYIKYSYLTKGGTGK